MISIEDRQTSSRYKTKGEICLIIETDVCWCDELYISLFNTDLFSLCYNLFIVFLRLIEQLCISWGFMHGFRDAQWKSNLFIHQSRIYLFLCPSIYICVYICMYVSACIRRYVGSKVAKETKKFANS